MNSTTQRAEIIEGSANTLLARVVAGNGSPLQQAAVSSISCKVFDRTTGTQTATLTPVISSTIYDSLQIDARWTADLTGYNFALPIDGSAFPAGNTTYRVEVKITPVGGSPFYLLWDLQSTLVYSQ